MPVSAYGSDLGKGTWRRLINIALEDVGIAAPELINDLSCLAFDQNLREVVGSDVELLLAMAERLAAAPKDRSADYLFCAVKKQPDVRTNVSQLTALSIPDRLAIACDADAPLKRRAVAVLSSCTGEIGPKPTARQHAAREFFRAVHGHCHSAFHPALECIATKTGHPFAYLFPTARADAKHPHRLAMSAQFRRTVIRAKLDPGKVTPHILRHTAITGLVKAGVDLPTIQLFSGHKTLSMVLRYTHLSDDHIDQAVAKMNSAFSEAITPKLHKPNSQAERSAA